MVHGLLGRLLDTTVVASFTRPGFSVREPTWSASSIPTSLAGRTYAVTGANSGIGQAVADGLARRGVAGASLVAIGAILNTAGSFAPAAARLFDPAEPAGAATARALLAVSIYADAAFNLALAFGLVAINVSLLRDGAVPVWFAALGIVAGVASLPVAGQAVSDTLARGILISGPLWLAWLIAFAVRGFRG